MDTSKFQLRQETDDRHCVTHASLIKSLWTYNLISIAVSLLGNLLSRYIFRRKLKKGRLPGDISPIRVVISACGGIVFSVLVAYYAAKLVDKSCPPGVICSSPGYGLLVWATRPRGTAGVFLINAPFAINGILRDDKERERILPRRSNTQRHQQRTFRVRNNATRPRNPSEQYPSLGEEHILQELSQGRWLANPFVKTCLVSIITEAYINLIGVRIWSMPTYYNWGKDVMESNWDTDRSFCVMTLQAMVNQDGYNSTSPIDGNILVGDRYGATCTRSTDQKLIIASYGLWVSCVPVAIIVFFLSWSIFGLWTIEFGLPLIVQEPVSEKKKRKIIMRAENSKFLNGLWTIFGGVWVLVALTFAFSWLMWSAYLNGTADQDYCVGSTNGINALFTAYPVLLAIWREIV